MGCSHERPTQRLCVDDASLTIANAAAQKPRLVAALRAPYTVTELDLSKIEEFDSAGIQLLLLACRMVEYTGGALRLVEASRAVCEVIRLFNLEASFERAAENCPTCAEAAARASR